MYMKFVKLMNNINIVLGFPPRLIKSYCPQANYRQIFLQILASFFNYGHNLLRYYILDLHFTVVVGRL